MTNKPTKKPTRTEIARQGGIARRDALEPTRRTQIASNASRARWGGEKPIQATHAGQLQIGDVTLVCANLPDGRRVISEKTLMGALDRGYSGYYSGRDAAEAESDAAVVPRFVSPKALRPYFYDDPAVLQLLQPIAYLPPAGSAAVAGQALKGVNADAVSVVCEIWLRARDDGKLRGAQLDTAKKAESLTRALARTGLIALVDEATGYQEVRDRRALQTILDAYLRQEFAAWAKRFPDEFYEQIFKLRGWVWKGMKVNRPHAVAHYTKDIVYSRLAPGILAELEKRNPSIEGRRVARHHQFLTDELGHPALAQHLYAVVGLMRASKTWEQFMSMLNAAFPKRNENLSFDFMKSPPSALPEPT